MDTVILLFILIANIVAILLTYYSFDRNIDKSKRIFYTMIGMGVVYIITLVVYLLSSIGIAKEVSKNAKDMIIFSFVPVNTIIILPILIRSFYKKSNKKISMDKLNKIVTVMAIIALALVIGEFCYFKSFQKDLNKKLDEKRASKNEQTMQNLQETNKEISNDLENTEVENSKVENTETENLLNDITNDIRENEM